jgi:hypothetical protein
MLPDEMDEATVTTAVAEAMRRRCAAALVFVTVVAILQIRTGQICKMSHGRSLKGRMPDAISDGLRGRFK